MRMPSAEFLWCTLFVVTAVGDTGPATWWSAELRNLNFEALDPEEVQKLSSGFAQEAAEALGVRASDVLDEEGQAGHMTLHALKYSRSSSTVTSTMTATTTQTTTTLTRSPLPRPMRGITYSAMPCSDPTCGGHGLPSKDLLQDGYEPQWGASGRDDLATMARLGANTVRLYSELGLGRENHNGFLDHASELGLSVMPGFDTSQVVLDGECPGYDCFNTWKTATLRGFQQGFQRENGWHPAVSMLLLMNEPDTLDQYGKCVPYGDWCRVKAVLSAMDGVLAAEREARVSPGKVKLTVTWSFASRTSVDGSVTGPGIFGFQDIVAGVADPALAKYTPRTDQAVFEQAFKLRWVHGLNTRSPWKFVDEMVSGHYSQFHPIPWFIGEYGANGQTSETIQQDLQAMDLRAKSGGDFLGTTFFQFQTAYEKGGLAKNFGLFGLGSSVVAETGKVCDRSAPCAAWPVRCLTVNLPWIPWSEAQRARAVAAAWGGAIDESSLCGGRRLAQTNLVGTELSCQIRGVNSTVVEDVLGSPDFSVRLSERARAVLGQDSADVTGELSNSAARSVTQDAAHVAWTVWVVGGACAGLLVATGLFMLLARRRKVSSQATPRSTEEAV